MSILVYIESKNNKPKKSSFEVVSYAKELSIKLSLELIVLTINIDEDLEIIKYGPDKIINIIESSLQIFNAKIYADVIIQDKIQETYTIDHLNCLDKIYKINNTFFKNFSKKINQNSTVDNLRNIYQELYKRLVIQLFNTILILIALLLILNSI